MKKLLFALPPLLLLATPAEATGGFVCRTAGAHPIEVAVGFGHVPGSPLIVSRLLDRGRPVSVSNAQWWLDNSELRVLLISPNAHREEVLVQAKRKGHVYDGNLWRGGRRHWVRCREG